MKTEDASLQWQQPPFGGESIPLCNLRALDWSCLDLDGAAMAPGFPDRIRETVLITTGRKTLH
jgi:hypothetical protein